MKCILSGGGTGGHLYPALAIAEKIIEKEPDSRILFVGSKHGIEADVLPKMGYDFVSIPTQGMQETDGTVQKAMLSAKVGMSNIAGLTKAGSILRKFEPDAVVGTGGFVCFPTLLAAQMRKIPTFIHEQNAVPGRANKSLAKGATKLFVGFKGSEDAFGYPEKTLFTGNPVRGDFLKLDKAQSRERLGIDKEDFTVFAFGGSLGAAKINDIALGYLEVITKKSLKGRTLLVGTGRRFYDEFMDRCHAANLPTEGQVTISGYIDNIKDYIAAADLIICRGGALSLAEMMVACKPAIIVPIPNSVGNHQYYNGKSIADAGGAFLIEEKNLDIADICEKIEYLASNKSALDRMGEICKGLAMDNAAELIYQEIRSSL